MPIPFVYSAIGVFVALAVLACPAAVSAQGTCQPPVHGSPCAQGGAANFPGVEPQLNLGIGNPVHLASGNKFQYELDLPARRDGAFPALARIYNAMDPRSGVLGPGWQLAIDSRLVMRNGQWHIVQANGQHIRFNRVTGASVPNGSGALHADGSGYRWVWPDGTALAFDQSGGLVRMQTPGARDIVLARQTDPPLTGAISSITQGPQSIRLAYDISGPHPRLRHADTPAGRFTYHYAHTDDSSHSRLSHVTRPDGMQRHYLYEPAWQSGNHNALTGIALRTPDGRSLRIRSWAYDAQARVIRSSTGAPGQGTPRSLNIEYLRPATSANHGHTRVRHRSGQVSDFTYDVVGERYVLLNAEGAPCPGCPAPGTRAQYDAQGRLTELNGTRMSRDDAGHITRVKPGGPGWPGLAMDYDAGGRRIAWESTLTGQTRTHFDHQGLPARIEYANGDRLAIAYDTQGRPIQLNAQRGELTRHTGLSWRGRLLTTVRHPAESETRQYDSQGRLAQRRVRRPAHEAHTRLDYTESFEYDRQHRMVRHVLPEGGALHYEWGDGPQLQAIVWEAPSGTMQPVIRHIPGLPGYRYGNGLHLGTYADAYGRTDTLILSHDDTPLWVARRGHDAHGRILHTRHDMPEAGFSRAWRYAYDPSSRLIGTRDQTRLRGMKDRTAKAPEWLAWASDGSLAARSLSAGHLLPPIKRDASGLPSVAQGLDLSYGPQRRLTHVHREGRLIASYTHNAFGHQIRRRTADSATELLYLGNRFVAEGRAAGSATQGMRVTRRYIYAHEVPVGIIDWSEDGPQLFAVHADLLGAPRMVTDGRQAVRWLADYTPGGAAMKIQGDLDLDLRLPGQLHDPATGWHDNIFRTYMPQAMQYLEPDPLGPLPGHQALGYAAQQPARYVDPLGLLLMAFDGTRNDRQTNSNIWKLSQYYRDGPVFYHSGPGNEAYIDWDALTAWKAGQTVRTQWLSLMNALSDASHTARTTPIDILGFSRGAALARHFANEIARHTQDGWFSYEDPQRGTIGLCVSLRFMGLFDTVAQFGLLGINNAGYDLGISAAWQWVAHAVALNEQRVLFPLLSASPEEHWNTVEAPFIGAHADIGGGVLFDAQQQPLQRGDLSDIALNWMLWQARAAQVAFDDPSKADRTVSLPILHDKRGTATRLLDGDRAIQDSRGLSITTTQGKHPRLGDEQRRVFERYIQRIDNWRLASGSEVGEVDMQGYGQWLEEALGLPPI